MQPVAYTTDIISWSFILSVLRRIQAVEARVPSVNLNLEAHSCIVLCCCAMEAFVNEISSLTYAFLNTSYNHPLMEDVLSHQTLEEVSNIRNDSQGSFYKRYKRLLCDLGIERPVCLEDLSNLNNVRDALVHFRNCDIPIIDENCIIQNGQELPPKLKKMQNIMYKGHHLFADSKGDAWTLLLSTDPMVAWTLDLCLDTIEHLLDKLPTGMYRDYIRSKYACRDSAFDTIFAKGKKTLSTWWNEISALNSNDCPP